jgi:hypothetical protein
MPAVIEPLVLPPGESILALPNASDHRAGGQNNQKP